MHLLAAASDPTARWIGVLSLFVALASLGLAVARDRRDRSRLIAELVRTEKLTWSHGIGLVMYRDPLVKVRNIGRRPATVESIYFEPADSYAANTLDTYVHPQSLLDPSPVDILEAFGIEQLEPPVTVPESEVRQWAYRLASAHDEPWTGTEAPPAASVRAVVETSGHTLRTNAVAIPLRAWRRPDDPSQR